MALTAQRYPDAQNELMTALSTLHLGGKYSDLKIICNTREWAVHKAIVCSRSGFFDGACSAHMREARTSVIDLSEDDEETVEQMIHFLYHLDYDVAPEVVASPRFFRHRALSEARKHMPKKLDLSQIEDPLVAQACYFSPPPEPTSPVVLQRHDSTGSNPDKPRSPKQRARHPTPPPSSSGSDSDSEMEDEEYEDSESHLLLHTRVYAMAEKYDIPTLKQLAKRKFEIAMACYWDSPDLAEAIEEVYASTIDTDRGLRDVVLLAFRNHPQLATTQDVYAVIKETPSLAFELFKIERGIPV